MKKFISLVLGIFCTSIWAWGQITVTPVEATCFGANDAQVVVSNITGTAPFRIRLIGTTEILTEVTSNNSYTFTNVNAPATFSILIDQTVGGNYQPIFSGSVETTQPSLLQLYEAAETKENCDGKGSITFSVTGATAPYTAILSGGPTSGQDVNNQTGIFSFTGLEPGTYTVTVTDAHSCNPPIVISNQTIRPYVPTSGTISSTDVLCFGESTGSVTAAGQNGFPGYRYILDGANLEINTTGIFNDQPAGDGYVTIIDSNGCPFVLPYSITEPLTELEINITAQASPLCQNDTDGSATVQALGGTPGYDYYWYDSNDVLIGQGVSISGLIGGYYDAVVVDAHGCSDTITVTITPTDPVTATISSTNVTCANIPDDGTITISNPQGGNGVPFTYNVTKDGADITITPQTTLYTGLGIGYYTIVIYDSKGCSSVTYSTNIVKPVPITFDPESTNLTRFESNDGRVAVTNVQGGYGSYTYSWVNDADPGNVISTNAEVTGLPAGSYTVTIADAIYPTCTVSTTITITQPGKLNIQEISGNKNLDCAFDKTLLTVVLDQKDPLLDVEYSINGTLWLRTNSFLVGKGTYTFRVRYVAPYDSYEQSMDATVTAPDTIKFTASASPSIIDCNINEQSTITVNATGGSGVYEYSFDNGSSWIGSNTFVTGTGIYQICVRDKNAPACVTCDHAPISISSDNNIQFTQADAAKPTLDCYDETTEIFVKVTENTPTTDDIEVSYNGVDWEPIDKVQGYTFPNIPKGTYYIAARYVGVTNCETSSNPVVIDAPGAVIITHIAKTDAAGCNGETKGSATISVTGGSGNYLYQVDGGAWVPFTGNSVVIPNLTEGSHVIDVIDDNDCEAAAKVTADIYNPDAVKILTAPTNIICYGDASGEINIKAKQGQAPYNVVVTASGSGQQWTHTLADANDDWQLTGLTANRYTVMVTDSKNCSKQTDVQIQQPLVPFVVTVTTDNICPGGTTSDYSISTSGGVTSAYYWYYNATEAANYAPLFDDGTGNPLNQNPPQNSLNAGFYRVVVTDNNTCSASTEFEVAYMPSNPVFDNIKPYGVKCNQPSTGSIKIFPSGGLGGPYMFRLKDQNTGITVPGYDFQIWPNDSITGLPEGDYSIDMLDSKASKCTPVTSTATVGFDPGLYIDDIIISSECHSNLSNITNIVVSGSSAPLEYMLTWTGGTIGWQDAPVFNGLADATYTVDVRIKNNPNTCVATRDTAIKAPAEITMTAKTVKKATCDDPDGKVEITAQGGRGTLTLTFNGQNVAGTLDDVNTNKWLYIQTVHKGGNAILKVVDANNCEISDTIQVPYTSALKFIQKDSTLNACASNTDATITALVASSDPLATPTSFTYELYEGIATSGTSILTIVKTTLNEPAVFSNLPNGTYTVSVHDQTPCYSDDWIVILESPDIIVDAKLLNSADPHSIAICPDEPIAIQGFISVTGVDNPVVNAYWEYPNGNVEMFDPNTTVLLIQHPESGSYKLIAQVAVNGSSCTNESSVTVDYKSLPIVAFAVDTIYIPKGDTYQLNIDAENYSSYQWTSIPGGNTAGLSSPSSPAYITSPDHPYTLILTLTADDHCSNSDTVYIHQSLNFFIPNGFTPNGDGIHDLWIFNNLEQYSGFYSIDVNVFNRAGIQVYEGKGYNNSSVVFDGRLNGKDLPIGTYYYVVKVGPQTLKGSVTILR